MKFLIEQDNPFNNPKEALKDINLRTANHFQEWCSLHSDDCRIDEEILYEDNNILISVPRNPFTIEIRAQQLKPSKDFGYLGNNIEDIKRYFIETPILFINKTSKKIFLIDDSYTDKGECYDILEQEYHSASIIDEEIFSQIPENKAKQIREKIYDDYLDEILWEYTRNIFSEEDREDFMKTYLCRNYTKAVYHLLDLNEWDIMIDNLWYPEDISLEEIERVLEKNHKEKALKKVLVKTLNQLYQEIVDENDSWGELLQLDNPVSKAFKTELQYKINNEEGYYKLEQFLQNFSNWVDTYTPYILKYNEEKNAYDIILVNEFDYDRMLTKEDFEDEIEDCFNIPDFYCFADEIKYFSQNYFIFDILEGISLDFPNNEDIKIFLKNCEEEGLW